MVYAIVAIVIVVILAMLIAGVYNQLVTQRERVKNAWAQIEVQLKRRFDLIPNLVETVKGYATHEQETLEKAIAARNSFAAADSVEEKAEANNQLNNTLKSIFALAESYPDLKANTSFVELQKELSTTEDKIAYARQFYNDTVQIYNTTILKFPSNIVAGMFGFKEQSFFEVDEVERENVKVQF